MMINSIDGGPQKIQIKLWSSLDNNSCNSVSGMRRENKRYTSVTNDEDEEVIDLNSRENFTNEADDLQNTDEVPSSANELIIGTNPKIGNEFMNEVVFGSIGSALDTQK